MATDTKTTDTSPEATPEATFEATPESTSVASPSGATPSDAASGATSSEAASPEVAPTESAPSKEASPEIATPKTASNKPASKTASAKKPTSKTASATEKPLMPVATAVWLVDNTYLSFEQIAEFVGVHLLEVQAIADGKINVGGISPLANGQLTQAEIDRCQKSPTASLSLNKSISKVGKQAKKATPYVPLIKRQQRVEVIAWFIRHHSHLPDGEIAGIVSSTVNSVKSVRSGTHVTGEALNPLHPVESGFCSRAELEELLERHPKERQ